MVMGKYDKEGEKSAFSYNHLLENLGGTGIKAKSVQGTSIFFILICCLSTNFSFLGLPDSLIVIFEVSNTM